MADAERTLGDLAQRTGTGVAVVDHAARADCTDSIDKEAVGETGAGSADLGRVIGEALLASALAVDEDLIDLAVRAGTAVRGGGRSSGTDLAGAIDSTKALDAGAGLSGRVVDLIGSTFPSTDSPLIGEESTEAIAVLGG